jgi:hypothetical protein
LSIAFYRDKLGFEHSHQQPRREPFLAIVGRDHAMLFIELGKAEPLEFMVPKVDRLNAHIGHFQFAGRPGQDRKPPFLIQFRDPSPRWSSNQTERRPAAQEIAALVSLDRHHVAIQTIFAQRNWPV